MFHSAAMSSVDRLNVFTMQNEAYFLFLNIVHSLPTKNITFQCIKAVVSVAFELLSHRQKCFRLRFVY